MRPGLEQEFNRETAEFLDKNISYAVRVLRLSRLIQIQKRCVEGYEDGKTYASPIDPADVADSKEYLERLRQLRIPL